MAAFNKFNSICTGVLTKVHNLNADTIKVYLSNAVPSASNTDYNTPADLTTGSGYTNGGNSGGAGIVSGTTTVTFKTTSAITLWTFTGAKTFQYAVAYNFTVGTTNALIGWWDYGSAIVTVNGDTFAITGLDTSVFTLA